MTEPRQFIIPTAQGQVALLADVDLDDLGETLRAAADRAVEAVQSRHQRPTDTEARVRAQIAADIEAEAVNRARIYAQSGWKSTHYVDGLNAAARIARGDA